MSKRADQFKRRERDFYPTPRAAALPLLRHLPRGAAFWEPCAGDGALVRHLAPRATCVLATDIAPSATGIGVLDAMEMSGDALARHDVDLIVTNPPWPAIGQGGEPVIGLVRHLSDLRPLWLLLSWDFAANRYFDSLRSSCICVLPIGRVSWMENGVPGKDNAAWYLFDSRVSGGGPVVLGPTGRTALAVHGAALRGVRRRAVAVAA